MKLRLKTKEPVAQMFEETLYEFPKQGCVLVVPDNVGAWLKSKHPKALEAVAEERIAPQAAPRVMTAVVPEDVKPAPDAAKLAERVAQLEAELAAKGAKDEKGDKAKG